MSGDFNFTTPSRLISTSGLNEESQSSYLSSASVTQDNSTTVVSSTTGSTRKPKAKMEVVDVNGRTEFSVEFLAEYEWPQPTAGNARNGGDSFMIQEQIAEYLGVKSFKRKYPDLMRRPVDMEERNYIMEQSLASEKMCDLGLTAVYASEVLDIMYNDYPEKYEEYKRYQREKHYRDRHKYLRTAAAAAAADGIDRSQLQKDKAIRSAASWNTMMNKERKETRRSCVDLQTYVVQVPRVQRLQRNPTGQISHYPVALVPGQFSEYYHAYTPEELACYPINTALLDPLQLREILQSDRYRQLLAEVASESDSGSSSSSSDDDSSSDSDDSDDDSSSDSESDSSSSSTDSNDSDVPLKQSPMLKPPASISSYNSSSSNSSWLKPPPPKSATPLAALKVEVPKVEETSKPKINPYLCAVCFGPQNKNQLDKPERFIRCSICRRKAHPSCIDMSAKMFKRAQEYPWQCSECKSCQKCQRRQNAIVGTENMTAASRRMVFCDQCDRGFHLACIGLRNTPEVRWHCTVCSICNNCGTRSPEGHPNPYLTTQQREHLAMIASWTHEYATNELTRIREHVVTLCVPCARARKQQEDEQLQRLQPQPAVAANGANSSGKEATIGCSGSSSSSKCTSNNPKNNNNNKVRSVKAKKVDALARTSSATKIVSTSKG